MFWTWAGFGGLCYSRVSWRLCMSRTSALMCRLASLVYRCAQTLNTNVPDWGQITHHWCLIRGLRQGTNGQRSPQVALHPSVSVTVDAFRFRRTCWQLNWETKCSILLTLNGGFLLNVSWNDPKHATKENQASVLCEYSGTLVFVSAACTCLQGCVYRCPLGPSTSRKGPMNKRACCRGSSLQNMPVARLG